MMIARLFACCLSLCATTAYSQDHLRWKGWPEPRSGIVLVDVDKSGKVTAARMLKSTGDRHLDALALEKFKQWHFKAGATAPQVKIPITFTPAGAEY